MGETMFVWKLAGFLQEGLVCRTPRCDLPACLAVGRVISSVRSLEKSVGVCFLLLSAVGVY